MVGGHSMGPGLQLVGARFLNFHLGKLSWEFKLRPISIYIYLTTFKWPYFSTAYSYSHVVGPTGSPACTVYVDVTLTRSNVKVKVTGLLNVRQLPKPCMLAAMTAAPLRGFLVSG